MYLIVIEVSSQLSKSNFDLNMAMEVFPSKVSSGKEISGSHWMQGPEYMANGLKISTWIFWIVFWLEGPCDDEHYHEANRFLLTAYPYTFGLNCMSSGMILCNSFTVKRVFARIASSVLLRRVTEIKEDQPFLGSSWTLIIWLEKAHYHSVIFSRFIKFL